MEDKKKEALEAEEYGKTQELAEENSLFVKFKSPHIFDGESYNGIDLSGLENLRAGDMIAVNKIIERSGTVNIIPEMSLEYACLIAARATKKPVEFFQQLPPKDALKIKNRVTNFLYGED